VGTERAVVSRREEATAVAQAPHGGHAESAREPVVRVSCVRHLYPDQTQVYLCGLDFVVEKGQRVVILGPNGSGKSTLLFHILGLLRPREGTVEVFGVDPAQHFNRIRERVGVVLQNVDEQLLAPTVWDDVSFSPRNYGYPDADVDRMVREVMNELGIAHLRDKVCHYLSGGEKRKVALAGALVLRPELLILDEPFEGLDPRSRSELTALLNELQARHRMTTVISTHDVGTVSDLADTVYMLIQGGEIVARGLPDQIFADAERLRASNIEAPALVELFQRLELGGVALGRPATVEEAARRLLERLRATSGDAAGDGRGSG
jgi:cobalt/nickel transport system ATP-binding protein